MTFEKRCRLIVERRKLRNRAISSEDWKTNWEAIDRLYIGEKNSLKELVQQMKLGFQAFVDECKRQCERRFSSRRQAFEHPGIGRRAAASPNTAKPTLPTTVTSTSADITRQSSGITLTPSLDQTSSGPAGGEIQGLQREGTCLADSGKSFFELCINQGENAIALSEINLGSICTDGHFFGAIKTAYEAARGIRRWFLLVKPKDIQYVKVSTPLAMMVSFFLP